MKKLLLSLCMILPLIACDKTAEQGKDITVSPVKIGVILPLTGTNSYMGEQMREGYEFVKEYLKQNMNSPGQNTGVGGLSLL